MENITVAVEKHPHEEPALTLYYDTKQSRKACRLAINLEQYDLVRSWLEDYRKDNNEE